MKPPTTKKANVCSLVFKRISSLINVVESWSLSDCQTPQHDPIRPQGCRADTRKGTGVQATWEPGEALRVGPAFTGPCCGRACGLGRDSCAVGRGIAEGDACAARRPFCVPVQRHKHHNQDFGACILEP